MKLKKIRFNDILSAVVHISELHMSLSRDSKKASQDMRNAHSVLIPWAEKHFETVKGKLGGGYSVDISGGLGLISVSFNRQEEYRRIVDLSGASPSCTCGFLAAFGAVCHHILLAIQAWPEKTDFPWKDAEQRVRTFFHEQYYATSYYAAFEDERPLERPRLDLLLSDNKTKAPLVQVKHHKGGSTKR
jgi:hypothetical protein